MTDTTAMVPVEQRAALALGSSETEKHLRELAVKNTGITFVIDKAGREQAHGAAMELKRARTHIEKVAKEARDDATKFSKAVIAEEKRLVGIIADEEDRLMGLRDEWDAEQERQRQEMAMAEQRRVERINDAIAAIAGVPSTMASAKSNHIAAAIAEIEAYEMAESFYEEFTAKAAHVRGEALASLAKLHADAIAREAAAVALAEEQARLAAEREELDRQRRELEEAKARAAAEAALSAQRMIDEANAKAKAEAAQRDAFMKRQHDAFEEEKRQAAELLATQQRELAEQQAAIAAQVRAQREAEEAARREREAEAAALRESAARASAEQVVEAVIDYIGGDRSSAIARIFEAAKVLQTEEATA